ANYVLRFWPVILIAAGVFKIVECRDDYRRSSGIFWIVVGGIFLLGSLGILRLAFHQLWPVVLIGFGVLMLWRSTFARGPRRPPFGPPGPSPAASFTAPRTENRSSAESGDSSSTS